jgi:hypothetical protein
LTPALFVCCSRSESGCPDQSVDDLSERALRHPTIDRTNRQLLRAVKIGGRALHRLGRR